MPDQTVHPNPIPVVNGCFGCSTPITVEPAVVGRGLVVARCRPFVWCIDRNGEVA